jgi:hypothetical protein
MGYIFLYPPISAARGGAVSQYYQTLRSGNLNPRIIKTFTIITKPFYIFSWCFITFCYTFWAFLWGVFKIKRFDKPWFLWYKRYGDMRFERFEGLG